MSNSLPKKPRRIDRTLGAVMGGTFLGLAVVLALIVNWGMRQEALRDAEVTGLTILEEGLETRSFFLHDLRSGLDGLLRDRGSIADGESSALASSFVVERMQQFFSVKSSPDCFHRAEFFNIRDLDNEGGVIDDDMVERFRSDPSLREISTVLDLEGRPFYFLVSRGESIGEGCLGCHGSGGNVPAAMKDHPEAGRLIDFRAGDLITLALVRIPLTEPFARAETFSFHLCLTLAALLLSAGFLQWCLVRRLLVKPLGAIHQKVLQITADDVHLGESIDVSACLELNEVAAAFNGMSASLKEEREQLETLVKRRTEELETANGRLHLLLRSNPSVIYTCEPAGVYGVTFISSNVRDQLGYEARDFLEDPHFWARNIHPEDAPEVFEGLKRLPERGYHVHEYRFRHKSGQWRWMHDELKLVRDEEGRPIEILGVWLDITERKEMERALRESEMRYRDLYKNAPIMLQSIDQDGRLASVNNSWLENLGYGREEVIGRKSVEFLSEESRRQVLERYLPELQEAGAVKDVPCQLVKKDGERIDTLLTAFSERDPRGRISSISAALVDISLQKQAEETIQTLVKSTVGTMGREFFERIVYELCSWLQADCAIVGEIVEGQEVRTLAMLLDGSLLEGYSYPLAGTPCQRVADEGFCHFPEGVGRLFPENEELNKLGADGYLGIPLYKGGDLVGTIGVISRRPMNLPDRASEALSIIAAKAASEIERERSEKALLENEWKYRRLSQEFQSLLDGIPDAIFLLSREMKVVWGNRGAGSHLRRAPETIPGTFCKELWQGLEPPCYDCPVSACFELGTTQDAAFESSDGRTWGIKVFPIKNQDGKVENVIKLVSDISEKKSLREEAMRANRLAAVGQVAAGVAHEINNPNALILLNSPALIDAFADALPILEGHYREKGKFDLGGLDFSEMSREVPAMQKEILESAERIRRIVEDLKSFSRAESFEPKDKVDLNEVVRAAMRLTANAVKKATDNLEVSLESELPPLQGSFQRIEQVVLNLVLNACQALPERSKGIRISTFADQEKGVAVLEVRDEGVGIAGENLSKITTPFFTTKRESGGTGLGLSVSSRIVREHRGRLLFSSKDAEGTTARLELPIPKEVNA